jgi:hypothetical protein
MHAKVPGRSRLTDLALAVVLMIASLVAQAQTQEGPNQTRTSEVTERLGHPQSRIAARVAEFIDGS